MTETSTILDSIADFEAFDKGDTSRVETHVVTVGEPPVYDANAIKRLRETLDVTQRKLARMLAVSPRTVEAWEAGRTTPAASARRLLELLTVNPDAFHALGF